MPVGCAWRREYAADWLLVVLLTLAALAMRRAQAWESLWLDELHTSWVVADGAEAVPSRAMIGNQPPTYFYLVWATVQTLGASEWTLRFPSVLAGTALIPLSFVLIGHATRSRAAAWTAAFVAAIDRDFLFYATEARVYALVQLLAVVRFWVFWQSLQTPQTRWRAAYIALAAVMFYCHYTTALLWIGEAACAAVWMLRQPEPDGTAKRFLTDSALLFVSCLPATAHVLEIYGRRDNWALFIPRPTLEHLARPAFLQRSGLLACYLAPAAFCGGAAWLRRVHGAEKQNALPNVSRLRLLLMILLIWTAAPVATAWLLSVGDVVRVFFYRFLIGAAAAVPLLAGLLCGLAPTRTWRGTAAVSTTLVALLALGPRYASQFHADGRFLSDRHENWRGAVAYVNEHDDALPVLVDAGLIEANHPSATFDATVQPYCLLPVAGLYAIDTARHSRFAVALRRSDGFPPEARRAVAEQGGAWLLLRARPSSAARVADSVRRKFADRAARIADTTSFGGVQVLRIELAPLPR